MTVTDIGYQSVRKSNKVVFEFESGTKLGIEMWRIIEAIEFLKNRGIVAIGGRISEEYPKDSLEGHLKEMAKEKYGRKNRYKDRRRSIIS
ncbi:hypothetical protein [Methermicoccus shengliensis]|uniref:hypothetical protein n=1 Tax=Methermicoccus shengliensis TaxID=660064 RepID=UPI00076BEC4F|nr:hypothetical protein [Methermicoccus shengliensis]KUK04261.1 MAG: hypothetical protein XD46_0986 [Euryarchaeota archaeon 55_53]MDN5295137.1 hypothetical protein [Methanosarcinales archaeon]